MGLLDFPIKDTYSISQGFGENLVNYQALGMKGHNGLDIACATGSGLYACQDGEVIGVNTGQALNDKTGYGNYIRQLTTIDPTDTNVPNAAYYDIIYGHLLTVYVRPGDKIIKGQLIGLTDNTGNSTGPHCHWGVRYMDNNKTVLDYNNGYFGYVDVKPLINPTTLAIVYPVDNRYGQAQDKLLEGFWALKNEAYAKRKCAENAVPYTDRIKKAFVYGKWDSFTNLDKKQYGVFDVAMYETWLHLTKPEFLKKLGR
jgi:murein DD-endopeptidase MepM/ murein hydrolase activator NlpD